MKVTITLDGSTFEKNIPIRWAEVTFRQAVGLNQIQRQKGDIKHIIALFTGLDPEIFRVAIVHNLDRVIAMLQFVYTEMPQEVPKTCLGYPIVQDLESKCVAQAADVMEIMGTFKEDTPTENLMQYPLICATYISPEWFLNKEYDFKQAEKVAEKFFDAPCTEVMAIGNFTWAKYVAWRSGMLTTSRPVVTRKNKLRQGMINWLVTLAFTIRWYLWKRSLRSPVRNYLNGLFKSSSIT